MVSPAAYGSGWPVQGVKANWQVPFRIEARILEPSSPSLWAGFWMMSTDRPTTQPIHELDIAEERVTLKTQAGCHQHTWVSGADIKPWDGAASISDMTQNWHVYSADVTDTGVTYSVDGIPCGSTAPAVDGSMFLIFTNWIAKPGTWGAAGGTIDPADPGPWDMKVDYVQVIQ